LHTGNISSADATIGTSLTTIATLGGIEIKAQIGSYLPSNHTYSLSIATAAAADTNQITLAASTKYKLTAGGSTYIFTTPADTWRNIYIGGSSKVGTGNNTKAMNFASSNIDITHKAAGTSSGQSGSADYFTVNLEAKAWTGATSSAAGTAGYMPGATSADRGKYLRGDGSWIALAPSISTGTSDTKKITITVGGETSSEYTVPFATNSTYSTHLNATNLVGSSTWTWNPFSFSNQYWCWGESLRNSNIGSDTGDIRFYLAKFTSNGVNGPTGLCMNIDGCIASASQIYA
jgi:hypothetical protein